MSTFKGIVAEFPQIRIDYFRHQPDYKAPLACFLSHVHSDHLAGLESMRAPFVYCSAATREILLRLEKHHYRVNYAKGILESHNVTYDRSMRKLAKPLPLETPTMIELAPGNFIRVTLLEANHCIGAVMFLIEGDSKAVLYTGDTRAEAWWVNSLVQNPVLLPYTLKRHKLDCLYLDTTFATTSEPYREFPSKAEGIRELLEKIGGYPSDTVFYFHSWTFGYENVWIALSAFLGSRIHVDDYRARIYGSLSNLDKGSLQDAGLNVQTDNKFLRESGIKIREAPALCGFRNGNHIQPGCLTSEESARIHSCEHGMGCRVMEDDREDGIVHIVPIVTRHDGIDVVEAGVGGGKGDLNQKDGQTPVEMADVHKLMEVCTKAIHDEGSTKKVLALIQQALGEGKDLKSLSIQLEKGPPKNDNQPLQHLISAISALPPSQTVKAPNRTIHFPYSRHSSYSELCSLVAAFEPKDVYPCTVDEAAWTPSQSIKTLFGAHCSSQVFRHDAEMTQLYRARLARAKQDAELYAETQDRAEDDDEDPESRPTVACEDIETREQSRSELAFGDEALLPLDENAQDGADPDPESRLPELRKDLGSTEQTAPKPRLEDVEASALSNPPPLGLPLPLHASGRETASPPRRRKRRRQTNMDIAYEAALGTRLTWADYGGLECTRRAEERDEAIL